MLDNDLKIQQSSNNSEKNSESPTLKETREYVRGGVEAANSSVKIASKDGTVTLTIDQSLHGPGFPKDGILTLNGSSAKLDDRAVQVREDGTVTIPLNVYDNENNLTHQLSILSMKGPGGRFLTLQIAVTVENGKRQNLVTKVWGLPRM
jgi:hypothetical protein